jgi:predicted glycosyltransferase
MVIGFGIDAALMAAFLRKPCIIFTDNEVTPIQNIMTSWFASAIITPDCFQRNIGKKQIRINGYKELAYLHPNVFKPDPSILDDLYIDRSNKYVILRFNAFDAVHDIGIHGFSIADQLKLVDELKKYAQVFISPEGTLSKELESYRLPVDYNKIHHVLYHAQLLVTDTQTMATEAAILGTPVVRCNNFVGPNDMGNFIELEKKYDLIYSFQKAGQALEKAIELIKQPDVKEQWAKKRQKLLAEKIDVTQFMVDFIDNYPESFNKHRDEEV